MDRKQKVIFNVLAKDAENAKELIEVAGDRIFVGVMVKNFATEEDAIQHVQDLQNIGVPVSVGLGAADPNMWQRVANVSAKTRPVHINQVFSAAGYTLGRMEELGETPIINGVIEPSGTPGEVYISTGPASSANKERVSCDLAAKMLAEVGIQSIKFYPIQGEKHLDEVAAMVKAAVRAGLKIFEPTGGITVDNVYNIVKICLDNGAELVIPHLYTSLINKETRKTEVTKIQQLLEMKWD